MPAFLSYRGWESTVTESSPNLNSPQGFHDTPFSSAHCPPGWVSDDLHPPPAESGGNGPRAAVGRKRAVQPVEPQAGPPHFLALRFLICKLRS